MARRIGRKDALCLGLLVLAFLLLAIQVALGGRGFHRPHAGFHGALEVPGRLFGWGAVAFLVAFIPHVLMRWWGSVTPVRVPAILGSIALTIGVGGLAGVPMDPSQAGGGTVAGGIAQMLEGSLGQLAATVVFLGIATAGIVLTLSPLRPARTEEVSRLPARAPEAPPTAASTTPEGPVRAWYPERRVGDDGTEIPMSFPGSDVGAIRFREPEPERPSDMPATEAVAGKPPKAKTIRGVRFADEEPKVDGDEPMTPGVRFRQDEERTLPPGVRYVDTSGAATVAPEGDAALREEDEKEEEKEDAGEAKEDAEGPTAEAAAAAPPAPAPAPRAAPSKKASPKPAKSAPAPKEAAARKPKASGTARGESKRPAPPAPSPPPPAARDRDGEERAAPAEPAAPAEAGGGGAGDPLYGAAVEAAIERGSASLVLLKRRLSVGYARAASILETLVADGVLGEMTASGSRPTLITAEEWAKRRRGRR